MPHGIRFAFETENEDAEILKLSSEKHDFSPPLEKRKHLNPFFQHTISVNWRPVSRNLYNGTGYRMFSYQCQRQTNEDLQSFSSWILMSHARPISHNKSSSHMWSSLSSSPVQLYQFKILQSTSWILQLCHLCFVGLLTLQATSASGRYPQPSS